MSNRIVGPEGLEEPPKREDKMGRINKRRSGRRDCRVEPREGGGGAG